MPMCQFSLIPVGHTPSLCRVVPPGICFYCLHQFITSHTPHSPPRILCETCILALPHTPWAFQVLSYNTWHCFENKNPDCGPYVIRYTWSLHRHLTLFICKMCKSAGSIPISLKGTLRSFNKMVLRDIWNTGWHYHIIVLATVHLKGENKEWEFNAREVFGTLSIQH